MKIKNNQTKERVQKSIEKSMSVIENICPQNNVCLGIKSRDTYHNNNEIPKFSMLTACEMLWAVTSSGLYSKAHYLAVELLTTVNTELESSYFAKQDRTYEKAFILLGTTVAGQSISANIYINTINTILGEQKTDGSWGSYSDGISDIRATALCLLALSICYQYVGAGKNVEDPFSKIESAIEKSCSFLLNQYSDEGYCKRRINNFEEYSDQYTFGIELTAWSTYALIESAKCLENSALVNRLISTIQTSVKWLCALEPEYIAKTPENEKEKYKKDRNSDEIVCHEYGAGGLDISIIALVAYRKSTFYKYIKGFDDILEKLINQLLEQENDNGEWWDKNSDSFGKAWTLSYALKALSVYNRYLNENEVFVFHLKQRFRTAFSSMFSWFNKYKLAIIFVTVTVLLLVFRQEIEEKITFFNSPIATAVGIVLSGIGVLQGRRKNESPNERICRCVAFQK